VITLKMGPPFVETLPVRKHCQVRFAEPGGPDQHGA
jgi:hypothetical protein